MYKSSLLEILKTFNPDELKKFEDFIKSPYFNKKVNVLRLFAEIKKYAPEFNHAELKKEIIWKKIFPGKNFNYGTLKNLIFNLQNISENFLEQISFEKNIINKSNFLLSEFMSRNLGKQFEKEAKYIKGIFDKSKFDLTYYHDRLNFESQYHNYYYNSKLSIDRYLSLDEFNLSLFKFWLINFFDKNYDLILTSDRLIKNINKEFIDSVLEFFENSIYKLDADILMYYYFFLLANNKDDINLFHKLKSLLEKNYLQFSEKQQHDFFIKLCNFCTPKFNINLKLSAGLFEIGKFMVENKLLFSGESKYISCLLYVTISEAALFCKEFDWAKKFIEDFKTKLDPSLMEVYYNKTLISYYFVTADFGKALELLSKLKITTPSDKLAIKKFQFMLFYELNYTEELFLLLDSSRHYISSEKNFSGEVKKSFMDFSITVRKLYTLKTAFKSDEDTVHQIENLREEISSKKIYNKVWLNQKLDELIS